MDLMGMNRNTVDSEDELENDSLVIIAGEKSGAYLSESSSLTSRSVGHMNKVIKLPNKDNDDVPLSVFIDTTNAFVSLPSLQDYSKRAGNQPRSVPYAFQREKSLLEMGITPKDINVEEANILQFHTDIGISLMQMYGQYEYPSIRLRIGSRRNLECHLLVLQCYSNFFRQIDAKAYSSACKVSLPVEVVSVPAFCFIYDWMLSNENPKLTPKGIVQVYKASEYLQVNELIRQCWVCFDDVEYYKEHRAFQLFLEATRYGISTIRDIMIKRITRYFLPMVATDSFFTLDPDSVTTLLASSTIGVNSEIEVFYAAAHWLIHNWSENHRYTIQLLSKLRFCLFPLGFYAVLQHMPGNEKIKCITEMNETLKLFNSSIVYCTAQITYHNDEDVFESMSVADQRRWVMDRMCPYHQRRRCVKRTIESYAEFENYLEFLKEKNDEEYWNNIELL